MKNNKAEGILAEFENPAQLIKAAEKLRDSAYAKFDCHSPFPVHGMDKAMGEKRSFLGWIVGTVAFIGFTGGFALEWWTSAVDYPLVIAGKPFFSYQAFGPVAFAVMVLLSAIAALFGMLIINKLPMFHHPVFHSEQFGRVSDDAFFVSIEANDPEFDEEKTVSFLKSIGGTNVEILKEANN